MFWEVEKKKKKKNFLWFLEPIATSDQTDIHQILEKQLRLFGNFVFIFHYNFHRFSFCRFIQKKINNSININSCISLSFFLMSSLV